MIIYLFSPKYYPILTYHEAQKILTTPQGKLRISLDLGLSYENVEIINDKVIIRNSQISKELLTDISEGKDSIYAVIDNNLYKISAYVGDSYLKLKLIKPNIAPTIEINGINMHRIIGTTPWRDAKDKVHMANISRGEFVLDIGTGLGYTAIHSKRRGAKVLSIEINPYILKMAEYNPWSRELSDRQITIVLGDAFKVLNDLDYEIFDKIIHDPPRINIAGDLYSLEFYQKLFKVLKRGGLLYHYTGATGWKKRRIDVLGGVASRLRRAGFTVKKFRNKNCVIAKKPY